VGPDVFAGSMLGAEDAGADEGAGTEVGLSGGVVGGIVSSMVLFERARIETAHVLGDSTNSTHLLRCF
jgi:hypothetical protein